MTLVSDLITYAYREVNLRAIGQTPTTAQIDEGLRFFNELMKFLVGGVAGEYFEDWMLGTFGRDPNSFPENCYYPEDVIARPPINARMIATQEIAKTIWLPLKPSDGSRMAISDPHSRLAAYPITLNGNGRVIEGADTLLLDTDGLDRTWFYRAELANWVRVTGLELTDEAPFPEDFDAMLYIMLAMRLVPPSGRKFNEMSMAVYTEQRRQFIARYAQRAPLHINPDLRYNAIQAYSGFWDYSDEGELYGR
ncbi:MAG: hypothetical protein E6Q77_09085 [Rhizobium sp.]|nr:MAG: hypothetical protein E6Q77_09085 [Rhizobium sp.]